MKKIIFLILLIPTIAQSQNWYPIGATWYYNYQEQQMFPANGYTKYTVVKDTVVDSKPSKLITLETVRYNGDTLPVSSLIVREENSKVYYYTNNTFQLMYDFTLNVGDTLAIDISSSSCDSVSPLIVDSIKNINISGTNLRVQYVKGIYYYGGAWQGLADSITFPIIEKVGNDLYYYSSNNFFFNPVCQIGEEFILDELRCYNDSNISYKGGSYYNLNLGYPYPCDTLINGSVGITELSKNENTIEIFPNPSSEFVTVKAVSAINHIEVYDFYGKLLNNFQPDCNNFTVNIKSYPQGVYFFIVKRNNTFPKYFKIIKT
jgi:hypothetical protein